MVHYRYAENSNPDVGPSGLRMVVIAKIGQYAENIFFKIISAKNPA